MIGDEPRIALAASPREWAQRLHRHVADHGGAVVRATVLHPKDALTEDVDVFCVDDTTSFLSPRLVDELHRRGRSVLGVFDPEDPRGKGELVDCGVDELIARDASPAAFVEALGRLAGRARPPVDAELGTLLRKPPTPDELATDRPLVSGAAHTEHPQHATAPAAASVPPPPRRAPSLVPGQVTAVAGVGGGVGATEVAAGLAAASGRRGDTTVLVDLDDVAPALAQRLHTPLYPNVRAALDAMERREGTVTDVLTTVREGRFELLPGLASPRSWRDLRPAQVADLLRALTTVRRHVLCNTGHRVEDVAGPGATARYGLARHVLALADTVVAVVAPSPVGVTRALEWFAVLDELRDDPVAHVVFNRAPTARFLRVELANELRRSVAPAGVWYLPDDARVADAAWRGELAGAGAFTRSLATLADAVLPTRTDVPSRRRRRPWSR